MRYRDSMAFHISLRFFFLIVLPIAALTGLSVFQLNRQLENETRYEMQLYAQNLTGSISLLEETAVNACNAMAYDPSFTNFLQLDRPMDGDSLSVYSNQILSLVDQSFSTTRTPISQYFVFLENENIPEGFGTFWRADRIRDRAWYAGLTGGDELGVWFSGTLGELYRRQLDGASDAAVFRFYARKLLSLRGEPIAVIVLAFPQRSFFLSGADASGENKTVRVLGEDGRLLEEAVSGAEQTRPLTIEVPYPPQDIVIEVTQNTVSLQWFSLLSFAGAAVFFLLSLVLFYLSIRRVFHKINGSVELVGRAITGEPELRIPVTGNDELAMLNRNFNLLIEKNQQLMREVVERELAQRSAQLQSLQHQINPHLFYNTLDIISGKIAVSGNIEMADVIADFCKMLRYNISSRSMTATLHEELDYVRRYAAVQRLRFGSRFSLSVRYDPEAASSRMIRMILQPIVENSLLHGMPPEGELHVSIDCALEDDVLRIGIEDDGLGMTPDACEALNEKMREPFSQESSDGAASAERGIGLENINKRLVMFYGADFHLRFSAGRESGVCAEIRIPYDPM